MSDLKLSKAFTIMAISQGLPALLDENSQATEAFQLRLVGNQFAMNFLEGKPEEKLEVARMFLDNHCKVLELFQAAKELLEIEINILEAPLRVN